MTAPGIGAVVAASDVAAIELPANFKHARDVGAWVGLTPRRLQSGEMDYDGHISRRGDERLRALLYEAALVGMLRQSVFGRLAGYEDVNDAERLRHDPAMHWVVGSKAASGCAASASQMGRDRRGAVQGMGIFAHSSPDPNRPN